MTTRSEGDGTPRSPASPLPKTATELRNEAARIREFALTVTDPEVLGELLAMAEELERRAGLRKTGANRPPGRWSG